jgi:hypothetical protein
MKTIIGGNLMNIVIKNLVNLCVLLLLVCFNAFTAPVDINEDVKESSAQVKNRLRAHIEFLADDLLQGRNTGSKEYEIAAKYVASHFNQYGLNPAGDNNSWFQSVPFIESSIDNNLAEMLLNIGDKETSLTYREEFYAFSSALSSQDNIRAELVFVGYGISSTELNYDDYDGVDVRGKIVVFVAGQPHSFPSEESAHLGDIREKIRNAAKHGAVGVVGIDTPRSNEYKRIGSKLTQPFLRWQAKDGSVFDGFSNLKGITYVTKEAGEKIFLAANADIKNVFQRIEHQKTLKSFPMGIEVTMKRKSAQKMLHSSNVIGVLEGSDPKLKDEYVVYTAHLDHIGISHGEQGDVINNGALDNASGIAVMLETIRQLSEGKRPKRSMLFVVVTAEEKGLLGSNYFAHYPTVEPSAMVANVNLDFVAMLYPFADVIAFGAEHSTLAKSVEKAALHSNIKLSPDPFPEQAIFVRSDHYSFVKKGIPSVYLMVGINSKDPDINGLQVSGQFYGKHYHQPSDQASLAIDYSAGVTFTKISIDLAKEIANNDIKPSWKVGDYFGQTFAK